jgi:hypothetical protein
MSYFRVPVIIFSKVCFNSFTMRYCTPLYCAEGARHVLGRARPNISKTYGNCFFSILNIHIGPKTWHSYINALFCFKTQSPFGSSSLCLIPRRLPSLIITVSSGNTKGYSSTYLAMGFANSVLPKILVVHLKEGGALALETASRRPPTCVPIDETCRGATLQCRPHTRSGPHSVPSLF